jgi:hypothetical protein
MVDSDKVQEIGKMLGANFVFVSELHKEGGYINISISLIDVGTGVLAGARNKMMKGDDPIAIGKLVEEMAADLLGVESDQQRQAREKSGGAVPQASQQVSGQTVQPNVQGDVYAMTYDNGNNAWKYWKNGVETQQFNTDGFSYHWNFHINGDCYKTTYWEKNTQVAIIEKNGSALYYLNDGKFNVSIPKIFVSGGYVYAAGGEQNSQGNPVATVWKNGGVLYRLTNGSFSANAFSLFVTGGDVYAAGYEKNPQSNWVATVWKNGGVLYRLTNGNFSANVTALFVTGGDVYAAGYERNPQSNAVATVWKNGSVLCRMTNGSFSACASSLFVTGGDVYAAGYEKNPQGKNVATIWKNDRALYRLGDSDEVAELVFVR